MGNISAVDYQKAADRLGTNAAAIKAVAEVESAGSGMLADGRPKILFERHVMYQRLKLKAGIVQADLAASKWPELVNKKPGGYSGGAAEHDRLALAAEINRDCALESCSWGAFQIMGFHWQKLQFDSLQTFINAMYQGQVSQLGIFVKFILADQVLVNAIRDKNWAKFADRYNGKNYAIYKYDQKMASAYTAAGGAT